MAYLQIRDDCFRERVALSDYEIYRDGLQLLIKDTKRRTGYILNYQAIRQMLIDMNWKDISVSIDEILTGNSSQMPFRIPTEEQILTYCINKAIIPSPYEEYY